MRRVAAAMLLVGCYAPVEADTLAPSDAPFPAPPLAVTVPIEEGTDPRPELPPAPEPEEEYVASPWVAASPTDAAVLALFTARAIHVTADDGASFEQVLATDDPVLDAAIDERGRIFTIAGTRLGIRSVDGAERWRALPDRSWDVEEGDEEFDRDDPPAPLVAARGGRVAVAVPHRDGTPLGEVVVSRVDGSRWTRASIEPTVHSGSISLGWFSALAIDSRGYLRVTAQWGQGLACGVSYETRYAGRSGRKLHVVLNYQNGPHDVVDGHDGWAYGLCDVSLDAAPICPHPPQRRGTELVEVPWREAILDAEEWSGAASRTRTLALAGRRLVQLRAGKATALGDDAPPSAELVAVDARGRALATANGTVYRFDGRWRALSL